MDTPVVLYEHPDDPYRVVVADTPHEIIVAVEAFVLVGDDVDTEEVRAECRRRGELITAHLRGMLDMKPPAKYRVPVAA